MKMIDHMAVIIRGVLSTVIERMGTGIKPLINLGSIQGVSEANVFPMKPGKISPANNVPIVTPSTIDLDWDKIPIINVSVK